MSAGRGTYKHLLMLAKKKPKLQEILDRVENMTDKEIDELKQFQTWIRKRLKQARSEKLAAKFAIRLEQESIDACIENDLPTYEIYQYKGLTCQIGEPFLIELENNDYLVIIDTTTMKVNQSAIKINPSQQVSILSQSDYKTTTNLVDYNANVLQPYLLEKYGSDIPVIATYGDETSCASTTGSFHYTSSDISNGISITRH